MYPILLLLAVAAGGAAWWRQRRDIDRICRERDAIEVEERRMFDFLHGLGEKLQDDHSTSNMHRFIVDGIAEVVGADGGILYLLDTGRNQLVPAYQSAETPPLLPAPAEVADLGSVPEAQNQYRSFVRLSALAPGQSFVGRIFERGTPVHLDDLLAEPEFAGAPGAEAFQGGVRLLAATLVYAHKPIGLLAMTRRDGGAPFCRNDAEVFASVAEQSAFALGSAIIHLEAAEKRRFERELTQASEIQRVLLPRSAPALSDYGIAAEYKAARLVSGDYYDYVRVDGDRYGIAIGDVSGKGIAASLIMAMCRSNLRSRAPENLSPAAVLHAVNGSIFPDIREDMFVSLLYLILERGSNEVTLARAGHEPPLLRRRSTGEVETVETSGLAAGIDEGPVFKRTVKDHRIQMEPGDILLLYTDGIVECESPDGDEFGAERLRDLLSTHSGLAPEQLVARIVEEVERFSDGAAQSDDITLIAIQKR